MQYRVDIITPLMWITYDRPTVNGNVYAANGGAIDLLGVTLSLTRPYDANFPLLGESITVSNSTGTFSIVLPDQFTRADSGRVLVAAVVNSGVTDTLNGAINNAVMSATITSGVGVPASGWCLIDSEWMPYTLSGLTLTFSERGIWRSGAASHGNGATVKFANSKSTAIPYLPYKVTEPQYIGTAPSLSICP